MSSLQASLLRRSATAVTVVARNQFPPAHIGNHMTTRVLLSSPRARQFSSHSALLLQKQKVSQQSDSNNNSNPEIPAFSFDGLGLSKNMKTLVYVIIGIFGTIETWFWIKAGYRWWFGTKEEDVKAA